MKKRYLYPAVLFLGVLMITASGFSLFIGTSEPEDYAQINRLAKIRPDYIDVVIPPNIAPMNFLVLEPGENYLVKISSADGKAFRVSSGNGKIKIPLRKWRELLNKNRGGELFFDVYVKDKHGRWSRYSRFKNIIARENIDSHIAYRLIKPIYNYWRNIGVYQRNLENYDQSTILHGRSIKNGCVNCHSFLNNSPDTMVIGTRSTDYSSAAICLHDGKVEKIGTKFGYTSWHPSGQLAAYSMNDVKQFFHTAGMETRDVIDLDSGLAYYSVQEQQVKTSEGLSEHDRLETYPVWAPDGKYLYFCSAPILWEDRHKLPPVRHEEVRYDLRRISYDIETDQWGEPETVLSADKTGLSIMLPRISPDGRFLLFCMCKYGCFPVYQPSSDLYMMELATGEYQKLPVSSEYSESWHSWSSNSRWIAFSSKRRGGLFTRTYFSYVDENGKASKQFIMPQKDPGFYDSFLKTYSVPEMITGPVKVSHKTFGRAARSTNKIEVDIPITAATPSVGGEDTAPWKQL